VPSISLKTKDNFGRKEPFQNQWVLKQSKPESPTKAIGVISEHWPKEYRSESIFSFASFVILVAVYAHLN
jgi:hypothetical protein